MGVVAVTWIRKDAYHMESSDGRFTLATYYVNGVPIYASHDISVKPYECLCMSRDRKEAEKAMEKS